MDGSIGRTRRTRGALPRSRIALLLPATALLFAIATGASAQQSGGAMDTILEKLQIKGKAAPASGFVRDSRPAVAPDYIPVGVAHPSRPAKVMTPAEVAAAEADLDGARERQQRRAGQNPAAVPLKPAKGAIRSKTTAR